MPAPLPWEFATPPGAGPGASGPGASPRLPPGPSLAQRIVRIIVLGGLLLGLLGGLAGCSAVRLGYERGPLLATWWLDRRIDFNEEQKARVRVELGRWFAWHRRTQLPLYTEWLARAAADSSGPLTAQRLCGAADEVRGWLTPAVEDILPSVAAVAALLSPAQVEHLATRLTRDTEERLRKALKASPQDSREAAVERLIDRYETFYGPLETAQIALIEADVRATPPDFRRQIEQRRLREEAAVAGLRRIAAQRLTGADALAVVRETAQRVLQPPQADAGAWVAQVREQGCELASRVHERATPAQRRHLRDKLKGWEEDARRLAARP